MQKIQKQMKSDTTIDGMTGAILDLYLKNAELPFLTISKERLSGEADSFCPGVTVYLDDPEGDLEEGLESWVEKEVLGYKMVLRDYELLTCPAKICLSECAAYGYTAKFLFENEKLVEPVLLRMYVLTIFQLPLIFDVKMYDSPYIGGENIVDYTEFINSIVVA